ncbi:MAG: aldehyde dehydrogenase family protein, partial [Acidimicrobiaceae bacterium]
MNRISHWVNNKVVAGTSGKTGKVFNPATGKQEAEVELANIADVDAVVAAAKAAFPAWRATNLS